MYFSILLKGQIWQNGYKCRLLLLTTLILEIHFANVKLNTSILLKKKFQWEIRFNVLV